MLDETSGVDDPHYGFWSLLEFILEGFLHHEIPRDFRNDVSTFRSAIPTGNFLRTAPRGDSLDDQLDNSKP